MSADIDIALGKNKSSGNNEIATMYEMGSNMPPFEIRQQFRPKLIEFFEMTNKKNGAYVWAEQKTKDYFKTAFNIEPEMWDYRTRKH